MTVITGKLPSPSLALGIAVLLCITSMFLAINVLTCALGLRPNALLFFMGELAAIVGCLCFRLITFLNFYAIAIPVCLFYTGLLISSSYASVSFDLKRGMRRLLFIVAGVCVVMIVLSRPAYLLVAIAVSAPLLISYARIIYLTEGKKYVPVFCEGAFFVTPIIAGAVFVMWYNYARFDSVFEFGIKYCTGLEDFSFHSLVPTLNKISGVIYAFFIEQPTVSKNFPFLTLNNIHYQDYGNFQWKEDAFGILNMPLSWFSILYIALLIKVRRYRVQSLDKVNLDAVQSWTYGMLFFIVPLLGYIAFSEAAISSRFSVEMLYITNIMAVLLLWKFVEYGKDIRSVVIYVCVLFLLIKSSVLGLIIPFGDLSSSILADLNPDAFIYWAEFFSLLT